MTRNERETRRNLFRPPDGKLELLFVGESAPASGRFFYNGDSGLYRAMRGAFQELANNGIGIESSWTSSGSQSRSLSAFQELSPSIADETFLDVFQASGCYLVDLCPEPVDKLDPKARKAACRAAEPLLAEAISRLQPRRIATVVRAIEGNVTRAILQAGWNGPALHLPYPGRWIRYRKIFTEGVVNEVRTWAPFKHARLPTP